MDEINHNSETDNPADLSGKLDQLASKVAQLQVMVSSFVQEKSLMDTKISDAQNRIAKILNKLPQQEDKRQLNLLDNPNPETTNE
jgi:predicted  nucleic acid-binding Zn-ribbon protein